MAFINDENFESIKKFMSKGPVAKNTTEVAEPAYDGKYLVVDKDVYEITNSDAQIFENLETISTRKKGTEGEATTYVPTRQMRDCCNLALKQAADEKKAAKQLAKAARAAAKEAKAANVSPINNAQLKKKK